LEEGTTDDELLLKYVEFSRSHDWLTSIFDVFDSDVVKMDPFLLLKEVDFLFPFQYIEWQLWRRGRIVIYHMGR